jgi:hypothetical protein
MDGRHAHAAVRDAVGRTVQRPAAAGSDTLPDIGEEDDEVQLVPAIYAWDPDVRFIYYRQISKWM